MSYTEESQINGEYAIGNYKIRWFLLAASCLYTILNQFLSNSFSTANEILAIYFQVSLAQLDWASVGLYVGTVLVVPMFAYLCYAKVLGYKSMTICGCICLLISCGCILLTIKYIFLFPMMVVATLLQGIAYCVTFSVGSFFAVLWFPDDQVGIAIAVNAVAMLTGTITSSTVPAALLKDPPLVLMRQNSSIFQRNGSIVNEWNTATYKSLMCLYSAVAVILVLLLLFFCCVAEDLLPKAPTFALAQKRITEAKSNEKKSWKGFVACTKELAQNKDYLLCNGLIAVIYDLFIVEQLHLSKLVNHAISDSNFSISASVISGYIILAYALTSVVTAFLSAKILLYFHRYSEQIITGTGLLFVSGICLLLSYYYKYLVGFYLGNVAWGVGVRLAFIPLMDLVTRQTYPIDEIVVTVWMAGTGSAVLVLLTGFARLLTVHTSPDSALIFMSVVVLFVFLLSFFLKPKNRRGETDQRLANEQQNISESSQLIR